MDQPSSHGPPVSPSRQRRQPQLRRLLAVVLAIASTSVPAGIPDESAATLRLERERDLVIRTAAVVESARIAHIAQRYRQAPEHVRRVVRATESAASRHGLPAALLLAMVETESSFNAAARSGYGARGLMQVVPRHHPAVVAAIGGAHRLDDPEANVEAGARILASYVERSGSLEKGLARYSGGATKYAAKVLSRQRELERVGAHASRQLDGTRISEAGVRASRG